MNTFSIYVAAFAALALVQCQPEAKNVAQEPELERLIADLIADDAKVVGEAERTLEKMGPEVVPVLFDRLVTSGWDLKPPLLAVLTYHGLDWAKKKLLEGTDVEKTHAALLFELIDESEHEDAPEFKAMVKALLKALESEDQRLRAAAAFAIVHDEQSTVFFQHLHRIVPALISSFDTDLFIRRGRGDPTGCVLVGISVSLDCLIGDRMAYTDAEDALWKDVEFPGTGKSRAYARRVLAKWLATQPVEIQHLRAYWTEWWDAHKSMTPVEIGKIIIERNLRLLEEAEKEPHGSGQWHQRKLFARSSLSLWTSDPPNDLRNWRDELESTYTGPQDPDDPDE